MLTQGCGGGGGVGVCVGCLCSKLGFSVSPAAMLLGQGFVLISPVRHFRHLLSSVGLIKAKLTAQLLILQIRKFC